VRSSPAIADSVVYIGTSRGRVIVIDAQSGVIRWSADVGAAVASTPAVIGGHVFLTTRTNDVIALDRTDGSLKWHAHTGLDLAAHAGADDWDYFSSSPIVAGGVLLAGSGDGRLHAFDADTGRPRWTFTSDGRIRSSPRVSGDSVVFATVRGSVYAVSLENGRQRWRFETEGYRIDSAAAGFDRTSVVAAPAVLRDGVFVGSRDGHFYALSLEDGRERWRATYEPSWVVAAAAVADDTVYVATSDAHSVDAYDATSGRVLWHFDAHVRVLSSPVVAGDEVQVGLESGAMLSLDRRSGVERWRYMTDGPILSSPAAAGDLVVVGSDDGHVYAWRDARSEVNRAVFWDAARRGRSYMPENGEHVAEYFTGSGYQLLDAETLRAFLRARIDDHHPSTVIFALDDLPDDIVGDDPRTSIFRRYIDAGGIAVWTGVMPPGYLRHDADGKPIGIAPERTTELTGVVHQFGNADAYALTITAQGRRLGLGRWWLLAARRIRRT
jgi:outer membrane protein assembly factor BamB